MNSIKKKISIDVNNLVLKIKTIDIDDMVDELNDFVIYDIKDYNDVDKIIFFMFVQKYIYLNPSISKFNGFSYLLYDKIEILNYNNISTSMFVYLNIFTKNNIKKNIRNILQIGIFPNILEAYDIYNHSILFNSDYIKLKTPNILYESYIKRMSNNIRNINHLVELNDFHNLSYKLINKKYDIICFNTYKNIDKLNKTFLNDRSMSSVIHFKYILYQIIFILNSLNDGGEFIILMPAYNINIYSQIVYLVKFFFKKVYLYHSEIDMSYRIFLIGKFFFSNKTEKIIKLNILYEKIINMNIKTLVIGIIDDINDIFNYKDFMELLNFKFNYLFDKINDIKLLFPNETVIKRIYYYSYHYQLKNTYKFLKKNINIMLINYAIKQKIKKFEKNIFQKITIKNNIEYIITENNNYYDFFILYKKISYEQLYDILIPLKYLDIYDLFLYDVKYRIEEYKNIISKIKLYHEIYNEMNYSIKNFKYNNIHLIDIIKYINQNEYNYFDNIIYSEDKDDIYKIFDYYNIKNIIYIDFITYKNEKINFIFDKYDFVIKFSIKTISPLLISIIYILSKYFVDCKIIKISLSVINYFFICKKYNKMKQGRIIYLLNNNNNDNMTYLVQINDKFVSDINDILFKLIISELKNTLIIKYIYMNKIIHLYDKFYNKNKVLNKYLQTVIY